jgi:hypothetical protein
VSEALLIRGLERKQFFFEKRTKKLLILEARASRTARDNV